MRPRLVAPVAVLTLLPAFGGGCKAKNSKQQKDKAAVAPDSSKPEVEAPAPAAADDPHLWLEDVLGDKAIAWVKERNAASHAALAESPLFKELYGEALAALNAAGRIPSLTQRGDKLYNFWKDAEHPRGIYRRTTLAGLRSGKPAWETLIDIDEMAKDGTPWVFKGSDCLPPAYRRCLVRLSKGGGDAVEVREYDAVEKAFVPADKGGFFVAEAKTDVAWVDDDHVFIGTDFGDGTMTESGYPRQSKLWKRGTPLSEAELVHQVPVSAMAVSARRIFGASTTVDLVEERTSFWIAKHFQRVDGELKAVALPDDANVAGLFGDGLLVEVKSDWTVGATTYREGSLVFARLATLRGGDGAAHELVVGPSPTTAVQQARVTSQGLLVSMLDNVRGRLRIYNRRDDGTWSFKPVELPETGSVSMMTASDDRPDAFVSYEDFLTPTTLYRVDAASGKVERLAQQPRTFDPAPFAVEQHFASSADGTQVPYFVVAKKDLAATGKNPVHIFSYGGFRNSLTPSYSGSYEALSGAYGKLWLERGGVFVLANIRGGGEFGPGWHRAALKENRPKAFEDFEAVAADLIARKVTAAQHIGIEGRSNGGLLVGATVLRRPDLYGAVICGVPLLDMRRYNRLFAGASWMGEYGNPDVPAEWKYIQGYSPYQKVRADMELPPMLLYTSTRDDRVHPSHARKMTARLLEQGHEAYYYENLEGGHGGSSTNEQLAYRVALGYAFLWNELAPAADSDKAR